jgi:hypothetical protein
MYPIVKNIAGRPYFHPGKIFFFFSLFLFPATIMAQDFSYGKASQEEMDMKTYNKDTSAHALVLNEFGKAQINLTNSNEIRLIFEYHVKIKLFDHRSFSHGTIEIPLRNNDNSSDEIDNISGITSYKDDNGVVQVAELDPKSIYKTNDNKYQKTLKFAMPGLRNGCVIEYRYILTTPFFDRFRSWQFQGGLPKLHTEYEAHIPGFWTYNVSLRGKLELSKKQSELERGCFTAAGATCDCIKMDYAMNDVPAFVAEEYMTAPRNFLAALNFDLVEYINPFNGAKTRVTSEWKDVDYQLKSNAEFGAQLKKKDVVKEHMPVAIAGITDTLGKAKAIYRWVQTSLKWNNYIGIYSSDGVKKALDTHSGSIADINFTLIDALNAVGIHTDAVLLSTREHGIVNKLYPIIGDFNYVIARLTIGNKFWFLDATDPVLPFGILPLKCLNDQGRVFSMDKPSYWVDLDTKQRRSSVYALDMVMQENGKLKGILNHFSFGYDAYLKRKEIRKFNSTDEYIDNLNGRFTKLKILKSKIENLDSLDEPLNEEYEIELDIKNDPSHNEFSLDPYLFDKMINNPFRLAERSYPVDMGMPSDNKFTAIVHIPAQYTIENKLQNQALSLSDKDGVFTTSFEDHGDAFTFSSLIRLNKAIYPASEYPYLKEFYNKIILAEKEELVFKKK